MVCDKGGSGCWCHIDWHCEHAGLVRVFDEHSTFGQPYCYALPFVVREKFDSGERIGMIEFVGVTTVMQPCQYRAMRKAVRDTGWGILSTRVKDGKSRTIEICKRGK